jgi:hypothetical protein
VVPSFQTSGPASIIVFEKVRVLIRRTDGSVALDTLIDFPVGQDEISLTLNVPLSPTAPAGGEELALNLEMVNALGEVVFRGGPISVRATQGTPLPPVGVPITYTGPGASAVGIELSPATSVVAPGAGLTFVARALDQNGAPLPGTPVQFTSSDPTVVRIVSETQGTAQAVGRGTARIRAQLVTGPAAEATVIVRPPATAIAMVGGNAQSGAILTAAAQPLAVRVTAADGLGVEGVQVGFAVTTGVGTLSSATATTDAEGLATVTFTYGNQLGAATISATATGLTGSPVLFNATAVPGAATTLAFTTQPVGGLSDAVLAPFVVEARDALGNRATSYTGAVTVALEGGAAVLVDGIEHASATLAGTFTVNAVGGVATFSAARVDGAVAGARFRASATNVTGTALSAPFTVSPLAATRLSLVTAPTGGKTGNEIRIVADARNSRSELVATHTGDMVATISDGPTGAAIIGADRVPFVNGVATLPLIVNLPGSYRITLSSAGMTPVETAPITVVTSEAATFEIVTGPSTTTTGGSNVPVSVRVLDGAGDPVANTSVTWTVMSGGGAATPSPTLTDANGVASTTWTVGPSGAQLLKAASGTAFIEIATTVLGAPANLRTWNGIASDDWHTAANWTPAVVPTSSDDVTIPSGAGNTLIIRDAAQARHFTVSAGALVAIEESDLQLSGNLTVQGAGQIVYSYALDLDTPPAGGALRARGNGVLSEYSYYGGIVMVGANTTISGSGGGIDVNVTVRNVVRAVTALDLGECLYIETDLGLFDPNGNTVIVRGDLETYLGGRLRMQSMSSVIEVYHSADFRGGNTTGLLTAGELRLFGGLYQYGYGDYGYEEGASPQASAQRLRSVLSGDPTASTQLSRAEQRVARRQGARRALLTVGETEAGMDTPNNFETSGSFKTRLLCTPDSYNWYGEGCYSTYIEFTHPSESKQQHLSFEGIGNWYSYGGLRVVGAMKMLDGAQLYDYGGYSIVAAGLSGAARTRALNDARLAQGKAALSAPAGTQRIGERAAVYGTACNGRLCIDGTLEGDATTQVYFDQLLLKGTIVGELAVELYRLQMHGTNQILSQVTNPGLSFEELRVFGSVSLVPGETVSSYYYGNAGVYSGGTLDLNGGRLALDYYGTFRTVDAGVLIMDDPNSMLEAGSGDFAGGTSVLTAGTIRLGNSFSQSGSATSFSASGTHTVAFGEIAEYGGISFGTPGPSAGASHFANLQLDGGSQVTLNSTVYVNGTFGVVNDRGALDIYGNAHRLEVGGIDIPGSGTTTRFNRVQLRIGSTGPLTLNNAVFQNYTATEFEDQLTITRGEGNYILDGIQFLTPCAETWNYVVAIATSTPMNVSFTNLTWPGGCTNKVATVAGAVVTGFSAPPADNTWTGTVDNSWTNPSNWSAASVPTSATSVLVPSATSFAPILNATGAVEDLQLAAGATIEIANGELAVHGNLSLGMGAGVYPRYCEAGDAPALGASSRASARRRALVLSEPACGDGGPLAMVGSGTTIGLLPEAEIDVPVVIRGTVSPISDVYFRSALIIDNGEFDVGPRFIDVGSDLYTSNGGVLRMQSSSGEMVVRGNASFDGGSTAGLLTDGELRIWGELTQSEMPPSDRVPVSNEDRLVARLRSPRMNIGGDQQYSFNTTGNHRTVFQCVDGSPFWNDDGEGSNYCNTLDVRFDSPDESSVANVRFEGPGFWVIRDGLKVTGEMTVTDQADVFDYNAYDDALPQDMLSVRSASARRAAVRAASVTRRREARTTSESRESQVLSDPFSDCRSGICVLGTLTVDADAYLTVGVLDLFGAVSGPGYFDVSYLHMRGTDQTLSQAAAPNLSPDYVLISGTTSLASGSSFTLGSYTSIAVEGDGVLTMNGGSVVLGDYSEFRTDDNGRLVMDDPADLLEVWNAAFNGGYSTLTAGTLRIKSSLEQGGSLASSFQASNDHVVEIIPGDENDATIELNAPTVSGAGSRFANLRIMRGGTISLGGVFGTTPLTGVLSVDDGLGAVRLLGTSIWTSGVNIAGAGTTTEFDQSTLKIGGSDIVVLNNASFIGHTGFRDLIDIERFGGSFTFSGINMGVACADLQNFVVARGTATFNFPSVVWPGTCTAKITTIGGATVTGFVSPP